MQHIESKQTDIAIIAGNTKGDDFIIGDTHGHCPSLKKVVEQLKENDRLFIVGDLFDRGPDSVGIYDLIMQLNAGRDAANQKVYVIRGNHETSLIKFYDAYLKKDEDSAEYEHRLDFLKKLGGQWAADIIESGTQADKDKLGEIVSYLKSLPYIMHVEKTEKSSAFNLVHADLPIPFDKLKKRISQNRLDLSDHHKYHATEARPDPTQPHDADENPLIVDLPFPGERTYFGHTICQGVRFNRRHYGVDVGTYCSDCICLVNHHKNTVEIIQPEKQDEELREEKSPLKVRHEIKRYFKVEKILQGLGLIDSDYPPDDPVAALAQFFDRMPIRTDITALTCLNTYIEDVNDLKRLIELMDESEPTVIKDVCKKFLGKDFLLKLANSDEEFIELINILHQYELNGYLKSCLFHAVEQGYEKSIKALAELDVDLTREDSEGNTVACIAAAKGDLDVLGVLADKKYNFTQVTGSGSSAIEVAIMTDNFDAAALMLLNIKEYDSIEKKDLDLIQHQLKKIIKGFIEVINKNTPNLQREMIEMTEKHQNVLGELINETRHAQTAMFAMSDVVSGRWKDIKAATQYFRSEDDETRREGMHRE